MKEAIFHDFGFDGLTILMTLNPNIDIKFKKISHPFLLL